MRKITIFILIALSATVLVSCGGGRSDAADTGEETVQSLREDHFAGDSFLIMTSDRRSLTDKNSAISFEFYSDGAQHTCEMTTDTGSIVCRETVDHWERVREGRSVTGVVGALFEWRPNWVGKSNVTFEGSVSTITAVFRDGDNAIGFALIEITDDGWGSAEAELIYQCAFPKKDGEYQDISDFYIERRVIELSVESQRKREEADDPPDETPILERSADTVAYITADAARPHIDTLFTLKLYSDEGVECRLEAESGKFCKPMSPESEAEPVLRNGASVMLRDADLGETYVKATYYKEGDIVGFAVIVLDDPEFSATMPEPSANVLYNCVFPCVDGARQSVTPDYVSKRVDEIRRGKAPQNSDVIETPLTSFGYLTEVSVNGGMMFKLMDPSGGMTCSVSADVGEVSQTDTRFYWRSDAEADENESARITAMFMVRGVPVGFSVTSLEYEDGKWTSAGIYRGVFPTADGEFQHITYDYITRRADEIMP